MERITSPRRTEILATVRAAVPGVAGAAAAFVMAVALIVVSLVGRPIDLLASLISLVIAVPSAIVASSAAGLVRRIALLGAIACAALPSSLLLLGGKPLSSALVVLLLAVATQAARLAERSASRRPPAVRIPGIPVGPSTHPVLFANPRSGGGAVEKIALADEARRRGIEYVPFGLGDDLQRLASEAADRGADVLGMAGGDGSLGPVAQVAMARDLAFVCVPVGTRNHFAKDLGLDPGDPGGALRAFGDAEEIRIDLGLVGDRVFVNNVSLGLYAMIVRTEGYRENKPMTAWHVLPSVLGPGAAPVDLRFTGPDGREHAGFQLILASNGPYRLTADRRLGSREGMDLGMLGIFAAKAGEGEDLPAFAGAWWTGQADPSRGWLQWVAAEFEVRSGGPIAAGVDGEALVFDSPLQLRSLPGALRVRVAAFSGSHSTT